MLAQLLLMHVATGNALALGLAAAHFNEHAVSLQGHANAHAWPLAHVASARQVSMASAHLSKLHVHWSGQAAVVQSTSAAAERVLAQLLLIHVATGNALALGLAAAHFNEHAVSLQGHANAHAWPLAHVASARQVSMASAHLSKLHVHWSGQAAVVQSTSAVAERVLPHFELMHTAAGRALADGLAAAHFRMQELSLQGQANAQVWAFAQVSSLRQVASSSAHLSLVQSH